jgi:hypothetical protein
MLSLKNKTLNTPGLEADYLFTVSPTVSNITSLSGRLYVSFPYNMAPRLNREGSLECLLNN